jgi:hypothetical protein
MHLYLWKVERLENRLEKYIGGQFQIETRDGIYRGEIENITFSDKPNNKKMTVIFKWWCIRRIKNNDIHTNERMVFWDEIKPDSRVSKPSVEIRFTWYYFQRDREDRKERIKLKTDFGESCRFYKPDDPTNLVRNENGEFVEQGPPQIISV